MKFFGKSRWKNVAICVVIPIAISIVFLGALYILLSIGFLTLFLILYISDEPPWYGPDTVCIIDSRFDICRRDDQTFILKDWKPFHEREKKTYSPSDNQWIITSWKVYDKWIYVKFKELDSHNKEYKNPDGKETVEEIQHESLWGNGLNMYGRFNRKTDERIYYKDINSIEDNAIRNRFKHLK